MEDTVAMAAPISVTKRLLFFPSKLLQNGFTEFCLVSVNISTKTEATMCYKIFFLKDSQNSQKNTLR